MDFVYFSVGNAQKSAVISVWEKTAKRFMRIAAYPQNAALFPTQGKDVEKLQMLPLDKNNFGEQSGPQGMATN